MSLFCLPTRAARRHRLCSLQERGPFPRKASFQSSGKAISFAVWIIAAAGLWGICGHACLAQGRETAEVSPLAVSSLAVTPLAVTPLAVTPLAMAYTCTSPLKQNELIGLVDKVQDAYRGIKGMRANFKQESSLVALDQSEESSGVVSFLRPGNMKWEYVSPEAQIFLLKDSTVWFYQAALKQVVIDEVSRVLLSDLPVSFLMGIGELSRDFSLTSACHAGGRILLDLAPRSSKRSHAKDVVVKQDSQIGAFRLLVDENKFFPLGAVVADLGGNTTTILFSSLQLNPPQVTLAEFAPIFPKGIDVSDRRAILDVRQVSAEGLIEREVSPAVPSGGKSE